MTNTPRLSHAESARTILKRCKTGALSTIALKPAGYPYASLVSHAVTEGGDPILLLSNLAEHTRNFKADPRASLLVTWSLAGGDPLADGRVSAMGQIRVSESDEERAVLRASMLEAHPEASMYIDFKDFNLYRLAVEEVRYIGGFGRMSWLSLGDWQASAPDPLWDSAAGIIEHMNDDHADAMVHYASHFGGLEGVESAEMVAVDRLGFDMVTKGESGPSRLRLGFSVPATSAAIVRKELVRMVREARGEG